MPLRDPTPDPDASNLTGATTDANGLTEAEFLAGYDPGAFARPSVATDVVLLTASEGALWVVAYRRDAHPSVGTWALPGGFVRVGERLEQAARRILRDKTGIEGVFVEQLYTFGAPDRDPRGHIISVVYYALVDRPRLDACGVPGAGLFRVDVAWPGETGGPVDVVGPSGAPLPLFVDHADVIGMAVKRLRGKLDYTPIGFQLLPEAFTLRELQEIHESIRNEPVNKDSFRRRMLASGTLEATGERERDVAYRPAELYRFVRRSAL